MKKRIESLMARLRPDDNRHLDALLWRTLATYGVNERERQMLLDHADAVEAGLAHGEPPEVVGAMIGIKGVGPAPAWSPVTDERRNREEQ